MGQLKVDGSKLSNDPIVELPQACFLIAEDEKVIGVPHIGPVALTFGDPVIHWVQHKIPPELAGKVSDWQAACARTSVGAVASQQLPDQLLDPGTSHDPAQSFMERRVVYGIIEFPDIALQDIAVAIRQSTHGFPRRCCSLARLA
jgi:hypothetical protein